MVQKKSSFIEIDINEIPDNVVIYRFEDDDFVFVDVNQNVLNTEQIAKEELIGKKLTKVFPGVKEFGLFDILMNVYETGKSEEHSLAFYEDKRVSGWRYNRVSKLPNGDIIVFYKDKTRDIQKDTQLKSLGEIIDNSINEVFVFDADTLKFTYVNKEALNHIGYSLDEMKNMTPIDIKPLYTEELFLSKMKPLIEKKLERIVFETVHQCKNGDLYDVEIRIELTNIDAKEQYAVIANDITERKKSEKKLKKAEAELKLIVRATEQTSEMVRITDKDAVITYVNDAVVAQTGYTKIELVGKKSSIFKSGKHENTFYKNLWSTVLEGKTYKDVLINKRKNGTFYYDELTITPIFDQNNTITNFVVTSHDITERIELEKQLELLATVDTLTGIYNRYSFNKELDINIKKHERYGDIFALLMFDIDHFKKVNDTYGHDKGDYVLKELSSIVLNSIRETDVFGRWGGEEFLLILPKTSKDEAIKVAQKIKQRVENYSFNEVSKVTISTGVSLYTKNEKKAKLLKRVDDALYEAKESGRNRVVYK